MTEEAKQARREYQRKWQQENRDKTRVYKERYWQKKAEQAKAAACKE